MTKPKSEPAKLTRDDVEQFLAIDAERLEASRKAANLEKQQKPLKDKIKAYVRENAKPVNGRQALTKYGAILSLDQVAVPVAWKDEFIKSQGAEAATKLQEAQPTREQLKVTALP